jgi:arylsulfatase A-like enzyme
VAQECLPDEQYSVIAGRPPHVVLFNPDQWRGGVAGHLGDPAAQTPVHDQLIRDHGTSFRWAFAQSTVCTPSRCSFLTGWYPHVRGHRTLYHMLHREHGEPMLLAALKDAGWRVFWGGKNDVVPGQHGLEVFATDRSDRSRYQLDPNWHGPVYDRARGQPGSDTYYSFFVGRLERAPAEPWYRDHDWLQVQEAIRLIEADDGSRPLCLYLPLIYPHPPYACEDPFFSAIDRVAIPPRIANSDWSAKPLIINALRERFGMLSWDEVRWTELRATYYAMCMRTDSLLGLVIDALKRKGYWDDTLLMSFSDHGDFTGDYGLVEKTQNTCEDALTRVPLVIKPPNRQPAKSGICDALVELVDISETVYDYCGLAPRYSRFGRSLRPLIEGTATTHRDAVFSEGGRLRGEHHAMERESLHDAGNLGAGHASHPYWPRLGLQLSDEFPWHGKATMCRTADWKYVRRLYEADELYDLRSDPGETRNCIADSTCAGIAAELKDRLLRWYQETCDVVPWDVDQR